MAEPTITTTITTQPNKTKTPQPPPQPPPPPPSITKSTSSLSSWGTLEELLLACAVNRHGANSWDSVAKELNNRRNCLITPHICRLKYLDLKRRFAADDAAAGVADNVEDDTTIWLDELRRLRVAELKRDLHRYDVSIVSLQLKVKKLKEEREKCVKEEEDDGVEEREKSVKVDEAEEDGGVEERENSDRDKKEERETLPPENGRLNGESSNESNFTDRKTDPVVEPIKSEPDQITEPVRAAAAADNDDDSCNGSSNSKESRQREMDRVERAAQVESGAESRRDEAEDEAEDEEEDEVEGVKESSEGQSTASLRRREKKMRAVSGNSSGDENQSPASKFSVDKEGGKRHCQALLDFLDVVRAQKYGSVFESRLESQESPRYKRLIKEHIDLGIIQKRVEDGQYLDCQTMFYRDLMLLINNASVFFSKRSSEHKAATDLRQLVNQHFQTQLDIKKCQTLKPSPPAVLPKPTTKPEVDQVDRTDLKPKLAITGPVIACRKRSSIAGKLSTADVEKKETSAVTVKSAAVEGLKQDGEKSSSTSFNAVTKKRTRDVNFAGRSSTSKNHNSSSGRSSRPSSSQKTSPKKVSGKGELAEGKADVRKPSLGNSSSKSKQASRPSKDLLLDVLDSATKRKIFSTSGSSSGNVKNDRHKDQGRGSHNTTNKRPSTEKGKDKDKEERESSRNRIIGRPPKRAAAMSAVGKRASDSGRDTNSHSKKRQRR